MVNKSYEPTDTEDTMLDVLVDDRDRGEAWYTAPSVIAELVEDDQYTASALRDLVKAGWAEQVGQGGYRFVDDPRDE